MALCSPVAAAAPFCPFSGRTVRHWSRRRPQRRPRIRPPPRLIAAAPTRLSSHFWRVVVDPPPLVSPGWTKQPSLCRKKRTCTRRSRTFPCALRLAPTSVGEVTGLRWALSQRLVFLFPPSFRKRRLRCSFIYTEATTWRQINASEKVTGRVDVNALRGTCDLKKSPGGTVSDSPSNANSVEKCTGIFRVRKKGQKQLQNYFIWDLSESL